MKVLLRTLRVISFIGFLFVLVLIIGFKIPFQQIIDRSLGHDGITGYVCAISVILFIAYPVMFLLTLIYMKASGWHIYLFHGKEELSLLELFNQNELRHFVQFLIDHHSQVPSWRFPYTVDFARGMTESQYNKMRIVAFLYRSIRCVLLIAIIVAVYYFGGNYIAITI